MKTGWVISVKRGWVNYLKKQPLRWVISVKIHTLMAYTPLAKGRLSRSEFLEGIGRKYGKTAAQVALNWLIAKENVIAIPKAINISHLKENAGAMGWRLLEDDMERMSSYFA